MSVTINEDIGRVSAEEYFVSRSNVVFGFFSDLNDGTLTVGNALNADQVTISVSDGSVSHNRFRLQRALLRLGADGDDGDIQIYPSTNGDLSSPTVAAAIHLNGSNSTMTMRTATGVTASLSGGSGDLRIGGSGVDGDIFLFDSDGGQSFRVDGNGGNLFLGGDGQDGDLAIYRSEETNNGNFNEAVFHFDGDSATLRIG